MLALVGSLAIHAGIVATIAIAMLGEPPPPPATSSAATEPIAIDIVELVDLTPAPTAVATGGGGGGSPATSTRAATPRTSHRAITRDVQSSLAEIAAPPGSEARAAGDGGGDGGSGGGLGGGHGTGIGLGDGRGLGGVESVPPAPPPAPARISKARPAKLIYPSRERDVEDGELFVARVTVDRDGYVSGARIVKGGGGLRGEQAASLIWRFRYAPALDDDGRAIVSIVEQPFVVQ